MDVIADKCGEVGVIDKQGKEADTDTVALAGQIGADATHRLVARIYYADTDFSGAVYHARYLEFLERGRSDFLRCVGVHHTELEAGSEGEVLYWVVRRMEIDFQQPGRVDDIITVETCVAEIGGARIVMDQHIRRGEDVLIEARVTAALINAQGRPRRFPKQWRALFADPEAKS
ncbi:MAG: tol-pal system-associated acyl-CoA thioesterase [Ahrensia sp.]